MNLTELANTGHFSVDTRTMQSGSIFVALTGPNFDGHDFIANAVANGAQAIIAEHEVQCEVPVLKVANTFTTLGELAAIRRRYYNLPLVAVTGSCGKTTTRTMIGSIMSMCGQTLATTENLNNTLGVPLTLLKLTAGDEYAVIEIGASEVGEIEYSANIAQPNVALITNAYPVHLEGFGTLQEVAREKGKILTTLGATGTAILNHDSEFFDYWCGLLQGQKVVSFGLNANADFYASEIEYTAAGTVTFILNTPEQQCCVALPLLGEHNVANATAAAAAAAALGIPLATIKRGLENMVAVTKRMVKVTGFNGSLILDDSYNANPYSMRCALKVLAQHSGRKLFIVGDMGELGTNSAAYHQQLGKDAQQYGVDRIYAVGELTPVTVQAFGANGSHFSDREELIKIVKQSLNSDTTLLIKGSKINRLWEVVAALSAVSEE